MEIENNHPPEEKQEIALPMSESEAEEIEGGKEQTDSYVTKTYNLTNQDIYYL